MMCVRTHHAILYDMYIIVHRHVHNVPISLLYLSLERERERYLLLHLSYGVTQIRKHIILHTIIECYSYVVGLYGNIHYNVTVDHRAKLGHKF
jgi:hypothetical protein